MDNAELAAFEYLFIGALLCRKAMSFQHGETRGVALLMVLIWPIPFLLFPFDEKQ